MQQVSELEPCPFCGCQLVEREGRHKGTYWHGIDNLKCIAVSIEVRDAHEARQWNTRAKAEAADTIVKAALEAISSQAICYGMRADENELRDWLRLISETAEAALTKARNLSRREGVQ